MRIVPRFMAVLCVAANALAVTTARTETASEPRWFPATTSAPEMIVYAPREGASGARPVTVMLHGMCDAPENECPWFASTVTNTAWLICPRGPLRCPSGGASYRADGRTELIDAAIQRVEACYPGRVAPRGGDTLIGFSLGAYVAMDVVNRAPARWARVVLLAAKVVPDVRALSQTTTELVLGAGDYDVSRGHMQSTARRLRRAGVDATFRSLGRVGHRFAEDMPAWLAVVLGDT